MGNSCQTSASSSERGEIKKLTCHTTDIGNEDIKLKCLHTNANSLMTKVTEVKFRTLDFDIIGIVETWTNSSISDGEVSIRGNNIFSVDHKEAQGVGA